MQHIVFIGRMRRVKTINCVKQRVKMRTFGALHKWKEYNNESNNIICKMLQLTSLFPPSFAIYKFCFTFLCWGLNSLLGARNSNNCFIIVENYFRHCHAQSMTMLATSSHTPSLSLFSLSLFGSWAIEKSNFQSICWLACLLQQFHLHSHIYNM